MNEWVEVTGKILLFFMLIPIGYGILQWKRFNKPLRIYLIFLIVTFLLFWGEHAFVWLVKANPDAWLPILKHLNIESTNFMRIFHHLNNFLVLGWFLSLVFGNSKWSHLTKALSWTLTGIVLVNYFFYEGHNVSGGLNSSLSAIFCFALPAAYMWYLYSQEQHISLTHNPYFWIGLGLIIPNVIGLFLYFAGNYIKQESEWLYTFLYILKSGVEAIALLLTTLGFYHAHKAKYLNDA